MLEASCPPGTGRFVFCQTKIRSVKRENRERRNRMKTLRWLALVSSLLIVGILIAPVSSEAAPTLVIYENKFDAAPNPAGNYLFAMRIGGYIVTGNTNGDNTDTGDRVMLTGSGIFGSTSLAVPQGTLDTGDVGGPASTTVSFSLSQTQPYNSNPCDTGSNQCTPTITQTLFFKDWNKDTLWLTNSSNRAGW